MYAKKKTIGALLSKHYGGHKMELWKRKLMKTWKKNVNWLEKDSGTFTQQELYGVPYDLWREPG